VKKLRLALYYVVGFMLAAVVELSYAESISATPSTSLQTHYYAVSFPGVKSDSGGQAFCTYLGIQLSGKTLNFENSGCMETAPQAGMWRGPISVGSCYYGYDSANHKCREFITYFCPPGQNWSLSGQTCTRPNCVLPEVRDVANGLCIPPPCPVAGSVVGNSGSRYNGTGNATGTTICLSNCAVSASGGCNSAKSATTGLWSWVCSGPFTTTGAACTSSPSVAPVVPGDPATKCVDAGQSYGTVNGVVVCVPPASSTSVNPKTVTGATSTNNITTTTVCDGDGACSTTISNTTTSGGSGVGGTGPGSTTTPGDTDGQVTDQSKVSYCEENPNAAICKAAEDPCIKNPDLVSCKTLGTPTTEDGISSKSIGISSLSPISLATNMTCPAPIQLPRGMGEISYQGACDLAGMMRPIVLVFAWLSAGLILAGALKNG